MNDLDVSRIKVVFFDIGGVLLSNGWGHESRHKAAEVFGLNYDEMNVLHNFIFNVFEIGSITLDDYLDTVVFNHPREFTKKDFKNFMFDQSVELPNLMPWLLEWKKNCGFRIFSINNESKELNDYRIAKFGLHQYFDGFISSCHVNMRKPDFRIYSFSYGNYTSKTGRMCLFR
jgi:putative hydrolase of the HAD superfamily